MANVYIGLGTNLGDKQKNLDKAIELISKSRGMHILKKSSVKETDPVDFLDQPVFFNQIILVESILTPGETLKTLQRIEKKMGKEQIIPKGPRLIDLDILLYNDLIIKDNDLEIPHPEIKNRPFILEHLVELNEGLCDPISEKKYKEFL